MKTTLIALALFAAAGSARAGNSFKTAEVAVTANGPVLTFTVKSEANVRGYQIEAIGSDGAVQRVATVPSKGNSMLPVQYAVSLSPEAAGYTQYRVRQVSMDYSESYSAVVSTSYEAVAGK